jgi:hypothetical protein
MAGIGGQHPPEWWSTSAGIYITIAWEILSGYLTAYARGKNPNAE